MAKKHTFKVSSSRENTQGFKVLSEGIDITDFQQRPVMLYVHDEKRLPIGHWENLRLEGDIWIAEAVFDQKDPFAVQVEQKVEDGLIQMASISVRPDLKSAYEENGTIIIPKSVLREISVCPIGSNFDAVMLHDDTGTTIDLIQLSDTITKKPSIKMDIKEIKKVLNLSDSDSDTLVIARIKEGNDAVIKLKDMQTQEATLLIDKAIKAAGLKPADKPSYLSFADTNFDLFKSTITPLTEVKATVNLSDYTGGAGSAGVINLSESEKGYSFTDWRIKNPNKLGKIKEADPEMYERIKSNEFAK